MFNVGGPEFLVILLVALIVLGPTRLPGAIRQVGRFIGEAKKLSTSFQNEVQDAMNDPVKKATGVEVPKSAKDVVNKFGVAPPFTPQEASARTAPDPPADTNGSSTNGDAPSVEADATQHLESETNGADSEPNASSAVANSPAETNGVAETNGAVTEKAKPAVPTKVEPAHVPSADELSFTKPSQAPAAAANGPDGDEVDDVPMFGDR